MFRISDFEFRASRGFTLVEVLVGAALFLTVAIAAYGAFANLFRLANANQANLLAVALADEQFEIVRNMPYVSVGLTNGIPQGILPQTQTLSRGGFTFNVGLTIRNVNFSTSTIQASDKIVQVTVTCSSCQNPMTPVVLTGQVSPANLQSASNGGALVIQAFDANGQPVQGASVNVQSTATSSITDSDVTNNSGVLQIIGVPQGATAYRISVTKSGYSTDRTYAPGGSGNPNPSKPDATVLNQQATQVSFAIDRLSSFNVTSVSPLCTPVPSYHFTLTGSKQIGSNVPKYSENLSTNGSGALSLPSMEWDSYAVTPTDSSYDLAGLNPYNPIALNPGNSQNIQMVVVPKSSNSLLVTVEDGTTLLPISNATVELSNGSGYDRTLTTGQGSLSQTDWSGGSGQANSTTASRYWADDGNVDTATSSGNVLLRKVLGSYDPSGVLESSTFDTGTSSNFYTLSWKPTSQPQLSGPSSTQIQLASNPTSTSTPWNYIGPDGTNGSYYSVSGSPISSVHNGNEFMRYKLYLSTQTATVTPSLSDIAFTYTSACIPPGQVLFQGLSAGTYTLTVSAGGYTAYSGSVTVGSGWQEQQVPLAP